MFQLGETESYENNTLLLDNILENILEQVSSVDVEEIVSNIQEIS